VVGIGELPDVLWSELFVGSVDHGADLAGVKKEGLSLPVAEFLSSTCGGAGLVPGEEPETCGDLGRVEELPGH